MEDKKQTADLTQVLEVINAKGDQDELEAIVEEKENVNKKYQYPHS
ncbi:hypothetical protein [Ammoniphilus resinae]|uniref:Uncharacterized protein n=1 Tax=Ammoniphilus resinae TaxID=861532 RepID=A0ABS4GLC8_9BACL|nr:hypothetical protein [Ammoniphilus resinae]MBP1931039.1 hypothetical protein [Ammoniphilus resinae]